MIGNPTPERLRVLVEPGLPIVGFPEMLESGALTSTERHLYQALALRRLEMGRRDLGFAAMLAAEVGSKKPAAA
jgi:hypothetical protein